MHTSTKYDNTYDGPIYLSSRVIILNHINFSVHTG